MTAARILTVRQPWAWAIIHGGKDVENRVRNIAGDYRGPVLIHAALAVDEAADQAIHRDRRFRSLSDALAATNKWEREAADLYIARGAIIGVVDLNDVHRPLWDGSCWNEGEGSCSPWAEQHAEHLLLKNPRALDEPIPYRGALGLRRTDFEIEGAWLTDPTGHVGRLVATS